jgi:GntR family transcriptional regulator
MLKKCLGTVNNDWHYWFYIGYSTHMSSVDTTKPKNRVLSQFQPVDPDLGKPLYRQIQDVIRDAISSRALKPNDALPPERELAELFAVSRITVRKAIRGLVTEGVLDSHQGSGTFVHTKVEKNFAQLTSFSQEMESRGMVPSSTWLSRSSGTVRPEEAMTLRASPGTSVFRFNRIRLADDAPMSIEFVTILASCLPSLESVEHSIYAALSQTGNQPMRALQRLSALILDKEKAALLGAQAGDAGLLVERVGFNGNGVAIEFSQSYYRGDTYDFVAELSVSE